MNYLRQITLCRTLIALTVFVPGCSEKLDSPEEFLQVAYRHERNSQLPEAVAAYKKSLDLDGNQPTAWYDLGVAYAAMDQFPEAISAYTKAIELDKTMARAFNNRAAAYARLKQFENAIADCSHAVELDPNDFLAWRNRGLARHDNGDLVGAMKDYDESIRINGKVAETYHYRGNVFLDQRNWSRALEDFNQAILLDEQMAAAWLSRAIALARLGNEEGALASREKAKGLGADVEAVVVADLLPDTSSEGVAAEIAEKAVAFVQAELNKAEPGVERSDAPWNLQAKTGDVERRYLVRVLTANGESTGVNFTAAELKQIQQHPIDTTLIVVQEVLSPQTDPPEPSFSIVSKIDHWTPDVSQMQPVSWTLPVSAGANDANKAPVASTSR